MDFICPNCILRLLGLKKKVKTDYSDANQMEQQQLISESVNHHAKSISAEYFIENQIQKQNSSDYVQTELNVQLNFKNQAKFNSNLYSQEEQNIQNYQDQQNQQANKQEEEHEEDINFEPNYDKFVINLQPYDRHYNLINERASQQKLRTLFELKGQVINFGTNNNKANLKVFKIQSNKFILQYQLPCTYSFYSALMKDSTMNASKKKLYNLIVQAKMLESFKPNLTMHRLRLERFNVLQRREFVYMKYVNGNCGQIWQVCISQPEQSSSSMTQNKQNQQSEEYSSMLSQQLQYKRCELFSVLNLKQHNQSLYIKQYLEMDLKAPNMNQNIWNKVISQSIKYFQSLFQYAQKNYEKQLIV